MKGFLVVIVIVVYYPFWLIVVGCLLFFYISSSFRSDTILTPFFFIFVCVLKYTYIFIYIWHLTGLFLCVCYLEIYIGIFQLLCICAVRCWQFNIYSTCIWHEFFISFSSRPAYWTKKCLHFFFFWCIILTKTMHAVLLVGWFSLLHADIVWVGVDITASRSLFCNWYDIAFNIYIHTQYTSTMYMYMYYIYILFFFEERGVADGWLSELARLECVSCSTYLRCKEEELRTPWLKWKAIYLSNLEKQTVYLCTEYILNLSLQSYLFRSITLELIATFYILHGNGYTLR